VSIPPTTERPIGYAQMEGGTGPRQRADRKEAGGLRDCAARGHLGTVRGRAGTDSQGAACRGDSPVAQPAGRL